MKRKKFTEEQIAFAIRPTCTGSQIVQLIFLQHCYTKNTDMMSVGSNVASLPPSEGCWIQNACSPAKRGKLSQPIPSRPPPHRIQLGTSGA